MEADILKRLTGRSQLPSGLDLEEITEGLRSTHNLIIWNPLAASS